MSLTVSALRPLRAPKCLQLHGAHRQVTVRLLPAAPLHEEVQTLSFTGAMARSAGSGHIYMPPGHSPLMQRRPPPHSDKPENRTSRRVSSASILVSTSSPRVTSLPCQTPQIICRPLWL